MLRDHVKHFVYEKVNPRADEIEEKDLIPKDIIEESKKLKVFGLSIPRKYGGLGLSMVEKCMIYEEIGKTHNGFTTLIGAHTGIGTVGIVTLGTEHQKNKYIPNMASGEWISAFALSEPSAGSNASALKTTAVKNGDTYIINRFKHYITNATNTTIFIVLAVTNPNKGARGITSFIVEKILKAFH